MTNITQKEVEDCENKLLTAMQQCDINTLDNLLHNDLLFNGPGGETISKAMDLAAYRSGNMEVLELEIEDQQISIIGDTAVVVVTVEMSGKFIKQPISRKFRYLRIWKKIEEEYKMIGGGCTPI